jgi:hypothetical protein
VSAFRISADQEDLAPHTGAAGEAPAMERRSTWPVPRHYGASSSRSRRDVSTYTPRNVPTQASADADRDFVRF